MNANRQKAKLFTGASEKDKRRPDPRPSPSPMPSQISNNRETIKQVSKVRDEIDKLTKRLRYIDEMKRKAELKAKTLAETSNNRLEKKQEPKPVFRYKPKVQNQSRSTMLAPARPSNKVNLGSKNDNRFPCKNDPKSTLKSQADSKPGFPRSNLGKTPPRTPISKGSENTLTINLLKQAPVMKNPFLDGPKTPIGRKDVKPKLFTQLLVDKPPQFVRPSNKSVSKPVSYADDLKSLQKQLEELKALEAAKLDELMGAVNHKSSIEANLRAEGVLL